MKGTVKNQVGTLAACLLLASSAWAEQDLEEQQQPDAAVRLEPMIVTAELLERSVQDSGASVELFDEERLNSQAGLVTLRDVLGTVPNISVVTGTGKAPTVRGVDGTGPAENANAFFAGSRPRLSWQIDGRPASYNEVVFGDIGLFDVERIEVLRGPQSTLVGRNAIAGTVAVKTHDPQFEEEVAVRVAAGNHGQRQVSGMVNMPLTQDTLALRIVADTLRQESAVSYDSFPGVSSPGDIEGLSLRSKLLFTPLTERDTRVMLNISHMAYSGPNGEIVVEPADERRSNFPQQPRHEPSTTTVALDYSQALDDKWRLQLNLSTTDFEFTRTAVPGTSSATIDTREYVIEPQLHYRDDGVSAIVGIYAYQARQDEFIEFLGGQNFKDRTDTLAAYAEGIVPLSEVLDLSLGIRYDQEDRRREGGDPAGAVVRISSDETYQAAMPKIGLNWHPSEDLSWGVQISKGYNAGGAGVAFGVPIVNYQYDEETVWNYEIYGRQQFLGGRIRTTQNLFYSRYKDMQLPFDLTPNDSSDEAFVVRNAEKVETSGLELGLEAAVTSNLDLRAGLGVLKTDIASYPGSGVEGNELFTAPEFTASLGFTWQQDNWLLGMSSRYSDSYFTDINNRPGGKTDAYVVADAQLSYDIGRGTVFASVKNLFDTDKRVARYPSATPAAVMLQPRTYLVGLELGF